MLCYKSPRYKLQCGAGSGGRVGWGRDWVEWGGGGDLTDFLSTFSSRFQPAQLALGGKGAGRVQCHFLFHMEGTGRPSLPVL